MLPALESTGLKVGEDFFLAFSSRARGSRQPDLQHAQHAQGGGRHHDRPAAAWRWRCTSRRSRRLVPVSSTEAAELVKILENTFRSVNIGLVNEMAIVCDKLGVDVWEVIEAAATKPFGFMKFTPGPGVGGHCIPLDPHYLAWKMRTLNYKTRFIELAGEINAEMPEFWVAQRRGPLNDQRQGGARQSGARARRRLQEGHRRHPREPGARRDPPARASAARSSATTIRTSRTLRGRTSIDLTSVPLDRRDAAGRGLRR